MKKPAKPLLSIGMIVKNEIRCIEKCLKALQPLRDAIPCELVIADTGSTDGTREIAERYADILFDFAWINDFAAARNAVMDRCSGHWYLSVDADEYLDPDFSELVDFLQLNKKSPFNIAAVVVRNYAKADDLEQYNDFFAVRLLRMSTGMRYSGSIHEAWLVGPGENIAVLKGAVLWHDGYINAKCNKGKRNIPLLEVELEKNPYDLRRLQQALESAYTAAIEIKYARRLLEALKEKCNEAEQKNRGGVICRNVVMTAYKRKLPELKEWLRFALENYANSLYVKVDVNYFAMAQAMGEKDYPAVIEYGKAYFEGLAFAEEKAADSNEMLQGAFHVSCLEKQNEARLLVACAYAELEEWDASLEWLRKRDVTSLTEGNLQYWLYAVRLCGANADLTDLFQSAAKLLPLDDESDSKKVAKRQAFVLQAHSAIEAAKAIGMEEQENALLQNLASMGEYDLAYEAQGLLAQTVEELNEAAVKISDWSECGVRLAQKLLEQNQPLPERFFEQSTSRLTVRANELAAKAADIEDFAVMLKDRTAQDGNDDNPKVLIWNHALLVSILANMNWKNGEAETLQWLADAYIMLNDAFLNFYYNPELLREETVALLPDMHHFGWLFLQAQNAKEAGNTLEYIRWLRKALKAAPAMKSMVEYLLDGVNKEMEQQKAEMRKNAPPELLAIAEQVRALLAQYAPDDPAVIALKQSPVYQKVAAYIETDTQE